VPERIPASEADAPDALQRIAGDAANVGMPGGAEIPLAAVGAGPETRRRRGLGFAAWLSIAWLVFVVGGAILAPYLPIDDPQELINGISRRGPFSKIGTAPGRLLGGDGIGRDMLSRLLYAGRTTLVVATVAVLIGFVLGGAPSGRSGAFGRVTRIR